MKNILELATKELKSSKKMVIAMIVGIVIVTILINSITTLALSYQEYIVNLSRSEENWEVRIENVPYRDVEVIEKNENIKEISLVKDLGISEESYSEWFTDLLHVKEYDENALKNLNIKLKKGRLPQNTKEIIVNEDMTFEVGDTIDTTINNKKYSYQIVGLIENTDFDEFEATTLTKVNGAITLLNKDNINENDLVRAGAAAALGVLRDQRALLPLRELIMEAEELGELEDTALKSFKKIMAANWQSIPGAAPQKKPATTGMTY